MFSPTRRFRRPLGYCSPESRLELHAEKALFRHNAQVLRDLCDSHAQQRKQRQHLNIYGDAAISHMLRRPNQNQYASQSHGHFERARQEPNISPDVRWLLTRSARIQRVNNAGYATFHNRIKDRVVSADGRKKQISLQRQRSMCGRGDADDRDTPQSRQQRLQCDVLGPNFCTDCTEISEKTKLLRNQMKSFPRIEVHTRSLVAPEKVEKIYMSNPKELFHQEKRYACGCMFDARLEITTPIVYTPHEVFERLRKKKQLEMSVNKAMPLGDSVTDRLVLSPPPDRIKGGNSNTVSGSMSDMTLEQRPTFYEEKTEPPMDLSVSVKIVHNGPRT